MSMWPDNLIIHSIDQPQLTMTQFLVNEDVEMLIMERLPTPAEVFRLKCEQLVESISDDFYQEGLGETRAELALDPRAQQLWDEVAAAERRFAEYLRGRLESSGSGGSR